MRLYRVYPYLKTAATTDFGGALYVPAQGLGRVDNPSFYSTFYAADSEAGAIAEAFGRIPEWDSGILEPSPTSPFSVRSVATFELPDIVPVCDLDNLNRLVDLFLRPSQVVTRDYQTTQSWAMKIFNMRQWSGVKWWSYYDSRWESLALWDMSGLALLSIRPLALTDEPVIEAARVLCRRFG